MSELRYDGRVVVVTGSGAGLGRAYALLFASRGAKVVVNDLGGGRHGSGSSTKAADDVVNEIRQAGGTAVADYNSVVEGEKIIQTALDNFGRIDVLVNNAGILRDKSFARISDQDWNIINEVHLKGGYKCTQAAWPIFKKQKYGRIIMTSSNSGLYGNFGQANYSAAKMGLVGLNNSLAIEGKSSNIHCNVIVPTAASRLTEDVLPPDVFAELKPELIAPVVAYLCHESCTENGSIIESAIGWAGKCHLIRANGVQLRKKITDDVSIENVRDMWSNVTNMKNAKHFDSIQEVTGELMNNLNPEPEENNLELEEKYVFKSSDLVLYALGVGSSIAFEEDRKYLYENHEDFAPIPTFFVLPAVIASLSGDVLNIIPGKEINLMQILHGEQYLEICSDLPTEGVLINQTKVVEVLDKGSGASIVINVDSVDASGELVAKNQMVVFAVGSGGFGGPRTGKHMVPCIPKPNRAPDAVATQKTTIDQAALYRLSGDLNPIHIDPSMAQLGGFDSPILHGLCSFGFSVRHVLKVFAGDDPSLFKAVKVRFSKPVWPGQTLKIEMWQDNNRIHFETSVIETNTVVISGAYVDLKSVKMQPQMKNVSASLQSDAIFGLIVDKVKADPGKAKSINAVFMYNITKDGKQVKQWTMDLKNADVYEGAPKSGKPNTTLTVSDEDFVQMALGKLNPQQAFMKGKLKVAGNIMLAQKLAPLLKTEAKL